MTIAPGQKGTCPHCNTPNRFENVYNASRSNCSEDYLFNGSDDRQSQLRMCRCTNCGEITIFFEDKMIYPLGSTRPLCPKEVPEDIANDYKEACLVEPLSKKAAAALARRCLQNMLHQIGISKKNLYEEIDEAMTKLPSHLSEAIDAIRNIGNFAAHPIKSDSTGNIVDVEEGETEWILDVLEQLFDFYYVSPARTKAKTNALNAKLKSIGKPELNSGGI
jgi:hypothetical protein